MRSKALKQSTARLERGRRLEIPRELLTNLQIREGDVVALTPQRNGILIRPTPKVRPDEVLTPAEARKVRHALKQVKEGKTKPWTRIKDELGL